MNGGSTQVIPDMIKRDDFADDEACSSIYTAFCRDTILQQAEFRLRKAFESYRVRSGLGLGSTPHLNKAYNNVWDVVKKHKSAQRS